MREGVLTPPALPSYVVITGSGERTRTKEFQADEYAKMLKYARETAGRIKTFNRRRA